MPPEIPEETAAEAGYEEVVVRVTRTAKVVAGGKRLGFTALAVVGNRQGKVGWGYGKAKEVPFAVEKAIRNGRKNLFEVPIYKGRTIPHTVTGKFKATLVLVRPASPGTGLKCGAPVRAVLELAGVKDALSKVFGSTNALNAVKATALALQSLRDRQTTEYLRGVSVTGDKPKEVHVAREKPAPVIPNLDTPGFSARSRTRGRRPPVRERLPAREAEIGEPQVGTTAPATEPAKTE